MKQRSIKLGVAIFFLCIVGLVYGQSQDNKVKDSFVKTIQEEFRSLQAWGEEERDNPEKTVQHFGHDNSWRAFYAEFYDLEYDIQKTSSIVTPYIGIVTFKGREFQKIGVSKQECLNADWKQVGNKRPTLKYGYQDGSWVIKEKPPVYRRH